ncbi:MAG TPA: site-2 protease family protein [Gemmatimonadales bacterium]|nr:site-2 protease family protein [Gemmatimonadales bacterium]
MSDSALAPARARCPQCGTELASSVLACPGCGRLVYADDLKRLAADAEAFVRAGNPSGALASWRRALELIPPATRQHQAVAARLEALSREVQAGEIAARTPERSHPSRRPAWARGVGLVGGIGLVVWKFKFVLGFLLTKGKLLVGGLTKAGTLFSMVLSLGVYWKLWGWKLAAGLIGAMYVHEMGHVAALRRLGIKADAPMFVPGLGAFVRMRQYPANPSENARVGLAGPIWGLGATLACAGLHLATHQPAWAAIARVSAWLNLFNLLPVWQLDGARGFHALSRRQRWIAALIIASMWFLTAEGLLVLLLIAAVGQAWLGRAPARGDRRALVEFAVLVIALAALTALPVPTAGP